MDRSCTLPAPPVITCMTGKLGEEGAQKRKVVASARFGVWRIMLCALPRADVCVCVCVCVCVRARARA